jgi:hypothetical protein
MSIHYRRPHNLRRPSFLSNLIEQTKIAYYQYEVTSPLYVMTPGERLASTSFMVIILTLLIFMAITYIPPLVVIASRQLLWLGKEYQQPFASLDMRGP